MAKYVYPVILTPETDGGYSLSFPDIKGCHSQGDNLADALEMAKDALTLMLCEYEDDKKPVPEPSPQQSLNLKLKEGQVVSLVSADTLEYRKLYDNKAIKKTLTIPTWLNTMAERSDINFSSVLQKALKEELSIAD